MYIYICIYMVAVTMSVGTKMNRQDLLFLPERHRRPCLFYHDICWYQYIAKICIKIIPITVTYLPTFVQILVLTHGLLSKSFTSTSYKTRNAL